MHQADEKANEEYHSMSPPSLSFWDYSSIAYRKPGVEAALLLLQQRLSLDINLVLYCFWLAQVKNIRLSIEGCSVLTAHTTEWQIVTVRPLRLLRQHLKAGSEAMPQDDIQRFRQRVQELELQAEHIEQNYLEGEASRSGTRATIDSTPQTIIHNLVIYMQCIAAKMDSAAEANLFHVVSTLLALPADTVVSLWHAANFSSP